MYADISGRPVPGMEWPPDLAEHLHTCRPAVFTHTLTEHPDLQREAIARLAESLGDESITCEAAVRPLVYTDGAPEPPRAQRAAELVRTLENNNSWMTLLNVEQKHTYRALIDDQLNAAAIGIGLDPASLKRRMGFLFASSPNSVTGAHIDIEHSILLQLHGNRTLSFGAFPDQATRDREVDRYWHGSYGKLTSMPDHVSDVQVGPGTAVYIPPYTPHWLLNGDATSLSLTITFFTRENETESLAQVFNTKLQRLGITPRHEGEYPARDRAKALFMLGCSTARRRVRPPKPERRS